MGDKGQPPAIEKHFTASDVVRDVVIGMSDGLTVPFAIAAGMTGAAVGSKIVVIAGLAEIAAGSISMGLGGYLAGRTDAEHYAVERQREVREVQQIPEQEAKEVATALGEIGLEDKEIPQAVADIRRNPVRWVNFMMRFELGLEKPNPRRALQSALIIALSYALSGFVPLLPYILMSSVQQALYVSAGMTLAALFLFGYSKGRITGVRAFRSGWQTALIGGMAAGAAFVIARLIS